ncbi:MAG: hypothetical protein ACXWYE_03300 [Actinomycetota bacterium]
MTLYAVAFLLMLLAGVLIAVASGDFLESTMPLLVSAVCSGIAIVLAALSVVLPRRK